MTVSLVALGVILIVWPMLKGSGEGGGGSVLPWGGWLPTFRGPRW